MTELETAIVMVIDVFEKYSCCEGNKNTLTKGELKKLFENELPGILDNAKGKDSCDKLLKDMDDNGDCEVDFNEFMVFVAALTCMGHQKFANMPPKK